MLHTIIGTNIGEAADHLRRGALVGLPTETVYGLAADATSEPAVRSVFSAKGRPLHNPLIVHVDGAEKIRPYVTEIPEPARLLLRELTPGPLTLLLPSNRVLPALVNGGRRELAFRVPAHPMALALLRAIEFPLVAPSANLFTTISPTSPEHVRKYFDGRIPYILDGGPCAVGVESTVLGFDAEGVPVIYRQGACSQETIEALVGPVRSRAPQGDTPSPGMTPLHYAPRTPLLVTDHLPADVAPGRIGMIRANSFHPAVPRKNQFLLSPSGDLREAARNLYHALHELDNLSLDVIIAEKLPNIGLGMVINDRLQRAGHPSRMEHRSIHPTINSSLCQD